MPPGKDGEGGISGVYASRERWVYASKGVYASKERW